MSEPGRVVLILATASDRAEAERLADSLVSKRLAACGSVVPVIHSFFRWEGRMQRENEALLLLKTTAGRSAAAQAALRAEHSYENPEILEVEVSGGSASYLEWVEAEVKAP